MDDRVSKRQRVIIEDDEEDVEPIENEDEVDSNPDEYLENQPEDEEDGEDLMENLYSDYAPAPELDQYDATLLADDSEERVYSYVQEQRARRAADEELDAELERRRRFVEETEDRLDDAMADREAEELKEFADDDLSEDEDQDQDEGDSRPPESSLNLEAFECPLRDWIAEERTRREIQRRFKKFIITFYPGIDEVTRFETSYGYEVPLPANLKKSPPIYPPKIR